MKMSIMGLILAFILMITIMVLTPSCKDKGGVTKFSHTQLVWNGKFYTPMSVYKCVMPNTDNE